MDEMTRIFAENFNRILEEKGLNMLNFSQKAGIPYSSVQRWGSGFGIPRSSKMQEIADLLDVDISDLVTPKNKTKKEFNLEEIRDYFFLTERDKRLIRNLIRDMLNSY